MSVCKSTIDPIRDALRAGTLNSELLKTLTQNERQECKDCITLTCTSADVAALDKCEAICFT